jgi:hypothetical protein
MKLRVLGSTSMTPDPFDNPTRPSLTRRVMKIPGKKLIASNRDREKREFKTRQRGTFGL